MHWKCSLFGDQLHPFNLLWYGPGVVPQFHFLFKFACCNLSAKSDVRNARKPHLIHADSDQGLKVSSVIKRTQCCLFWIRDLPFVKVNLLDSETSLQALREQTPVATSGNLFSAGCSNLLRSAGFLFTSAWIWGFFSHNVGIPWSNVMGCRCSVACHCKCPILVAPDHRIKDTKQNHKTQTFEVSCSSSKSQNSARNWSGIVQGILCWTVSLSILSTSDWTKAIFSYTSVAESSGTKLSCNEKKK